MTPEQFIDQCNKTPLLKNYRLRKGSIFSIDNLKDADFLKVDYTLEDLKIFTQRLTESKEPEVPKEIFDIVIKKRRYKDLAHYKLIQLVSNKQLIEKIRRDIGFPVDKVASGFKVQRHKVDVLHSTLSNTDFSFSPAFKEWFFGHAVDKQFYDNFDRWEKLTTIIFSKIHNGVQQILEVWELPDRYSNAIEELLVFNRIIPASPAISWHSGWDRKGHWVEGINYGLDVTKSELIDEIKEDYLGIFKNRKKYLRGKIFRTPRKLADIFKMTTFYNEQKRIGKKDNAIFAALRSQYPTLSISAIRKRIKG